MYTIEGQAEGMFGLFYKPEFQCGIGYDGNAVYDFRNAGSSEFTRLPAEPVRFVM
ncbi:hypothetical protein [Paenibacillus sedimenti]|uniref:Uncharacterized protein n=1 Tax=Paenibacillus sedimenti TaxID=2770274 RepID=A0A926KVF5_9BACL|nr:hypothetical protein [Paenibacillus sedimenti]MBD0382844.1 hypothetical protein [Paenibacillus sedimenti]